MNIAISGCGITGTTAAWFLRQQGHAVTIFEQATHCGPIGAGILLQPSGQRILEQMGLLAPLMACSDRLTGMTAKLSSGRTLVHLEYARLQGDLFGLGVHRGRLFELLLDACLESGVRIINQAKVTGYRSDAKGGLQQVVYRRNGQEMCSEESFDFLIAADGSRSMLRVFCSIPTRVIEYDYAALWVTGPSTYQPGELYQLVEGTHHLVGLLPIGKGECSYFWGLPVSEMEALRKDGFDNWKAGAIRFCPESASVLESCEDFQSFTLAGYRHVMMKSCYAGPVIFLGDAAHATSPHLGQGVNLGLEDAACFASVLKETGDFPTACARYAQLRDRKLRFYQQLTRLLSPFFQSHGRLRGISRDLVLPWLPRIPLVRRQMLSTLCGTRNGWLG